ncbi:Bug family tripartite tricarboxylate transporter substrate binding protein [Pseudorhodoplanes sinuspersici]|uniref:Uncharacterized protein n=2 Tax=Pseudorhodoplanes sinuspersici TaxID=1235591 RepID=A0A1W6ZM77_9HYPH|nr:hypothetical protein CAK95_03345 [Pseudorhodoplanes sinuspersici]RKE68014.1 tripartite-type tricarboxylate transporter receptor subunit TctC [Pseudorhodoplanes sinuspersici]
MLSGVGLILIRAGAKMLPGEKWPQKPHDNIRRKTVFRKPLTIVSSAILAFVAAPLQAQDYPTRPVKIIVQYPPGGAPDASGRLMAEKLSEHFGQPFFVENRSGVGGNLGTELVIKSEPDGYTLLLAASGSMAISPALYKNLKFKISDLAPISLVGSFDFVMMSAPSLKGNSIQEIVDSAKKNPGKISIASSGFGSEHHLLGELFKLATGAPLTHVPYKGFGPGVTDVMANHVELMFGSVPAAAPLIKGDKLVAVAVTGGERSGQIPDVPTFTELGFPSIRMTSWVGLLAPAGTPQPTLQKLTAAVEKILESKEVQQRIIKLGLSPMAVGPKVFADQIKSDTAFWDDVVGRAKIQQVD